MLKWHALPQCFADHSVSEWRRRLQWIGMADTLNTCFTNYLYCNIVVINAMLKYFLEYSMTFFAN